MPARDTLLSKEFGTEFALAVFGAKKLSCVPDAMRMRRIVQLQQTSSGEAAGAVAEPPAHAPIGHNAGPPLTDLPITENWKQDNPTGEAGMNAARNAVLKKQDARENPKSASGEDAVSQLRRQPQPVLPLKSEPRLVHSKRIGKSRRPAESEPLPSGLLEWTTPTLTEIKYTDELRKLYRCETSDEAA